jgi:hypothetical protein
MRRLLLGGGTAAGVLGVLGVLGDTQEAPEGAQLGLAVGDPPPQLVGGRYGEARGVHAVIVTATAGKIVQR